MSIDRVREFWEAHPVGEAAIGPVKTSYDYFRAFDNLREAEDVEPYAFSNLIHGYEQAAGLRVLDYGCGNGCVLSQYAKNGAAVAGVDLTMAALGRARERFRLLGLTAELVQGDGSTVPFAAGSFDVVCSMGVLHHVPDPAPIVRELFRVLKPGGRLIAMVYNRCSFRYQVTFRWRRWFGGPLYRGKSLAEISHMNDGPACPVALAYTRDEVAGLLRDFVNHRFTISKLGISELALYSPTLAALLRRALPGRLVPRVAGQLGWNLYVEARKP